MKIVVCNISFSRILVLLYFLGGPRSRGASRGNRGNRNGNNRAKYAEDFDFEEANSKFHKEEIEKELLKVLKKVKIEDEVRDGSHISDIFFQTAIWMPHGQLLAIIKESLTQPMLITAFLHFRPEVHREPHNSSGRASSTVLTGNLPCLITSLHRLNPLGYSP